MQIASYRDPQLIPTLNDLIEKAVHPENLRIVVNWQHGDEENLENFLNAGFDVSSLELSSENGLEFDLINLNKSDAKLCLISVEYMDSKGACWARNFIQQFYKSETYTLQLDSHHRFVDGWDEVCINMLESLRLKSVKPLLTAYVPSFNPEKDPEERVLSPWKMDFDRFIPEGAVFFLPSTIDNWKDLDEPIPARFYSAHFAFADGSFATEVQHDPEYFFHGEEISIAARAFTHGYDLYHPHRLICWHEYTRKGRTKVWDDHTQKNKEKGKIDLHWVERNDLCHRRNRILFGMDGEDQNSIDFGRYGFGNIRTLSDYEFYAGISFKHRSVHADTIAKKLPNENFALTKKEEFEGSLLKSNDIRILVHFDEIKVDGKIPTDFDFWYVGAHDEDNKEIYRKDYNKNQIQEYIKESRNDWIDKRFIFLADRAPKTYTIWPHSKSLGWLNKITKNVD